MIKQIFHFYQRKGYGKAAVKALREAAVKHETIDIEPLEENERFWLKCGFVKKGPKYMQLSLPAIAHKRQRTYPKGRC